MNEIQRWVYAYIRKKGTPGLSVYGSSFNTLFRQAFPGRNPRRECERLESDGLLVIDRKHNNLIFYLPENMPAEYRQTLRELEEEID